MGQIPLFEGGRIDLDNAVLHQGLRSDQFVIGGVVDNIKNFGFLGDSLRSPVEVPLIDSQGSEFVIAASNTESAHSFFAQFGRSLRSSALIKSLLLVDRHAPSGKTTLVS